MEHVIIIGEGFGFPNGMAGTSRVKNIAKCIAIKNCRVSIFCTIGTETKGKEKNIFSKGSFNNLIDYVYTGGTTLRSSNWYMRRLDDIIGIANALLKILLLKYQSELLSVIIYSRNIYLVKILTIFCKIFNITVVVEMCEWPLAIVNKKNKKKYIQATKFCNDLLLKVDGIIPISTYIENEVNIIARSKNIVINQCKMPILIDFESLKININDNCQNKKFINKYILYTGSIYYKEILNKILDTLVEIKNRNIFIPLFITGNQILNHELKSKIENNGIKEYIKLIGYLDESSLLLYQKNALMLLAPLPYDLQSISRFPTKIGYYLASGRPVITTSVGEVKEYLRDNQNAIIAKNFESIELADKIELLLNDQELADRVGKNGKQKSKEFDYKNFSDKLYYFLKKIGNK